MTLVTDTLQLKALCEEIKDHKYITVDTEFLRDTTYYPKLCLVQIASETNYFAVDPLAKSIDLSPLFEIFSNENIVKVFHSARQDIEVLLKLSGSIPTPLFDTQVAAMVCGFGESISYAKLVKEFTNMDIDKSSRFTDWSTRPLTDRQLDYALSDVIHLKEVYKQLCLLLEKNKRSSWLQEELEILTNPNTYYIDPENIWKKLKPKGASRRFLGVIKEIAKWRELKAQSLDKPRGHIIKDPTLLEIAANQPTALQDLKKIRGFASLKAADESKIIEIINKVMTIPEFQLPKADSNRYDKANVALIKLLKVLLQAKCEEYRVAEKLIACSDDLQNLVLSKKQEGPLAKGWRYEIFGKDAYALKEGKISLSVKNGNIFIN